MKKFFVLSFIFTFLSFYSNISTGIAQAKIFKEGFYKIDGDFEPNKVYTIQNLSFNDRSFLIVFDYNDVIEQSIRLYPQSPKYSLIPFKPGYKVVIVGNGEIDIS